MHVRAALNFPNEARETWEEPPEKKLKSRLRKPDIGTGNDEFPAGNQVLACRLEEEVGVTKMLDAFAAHNRFVMAQVTGEAKVEINIPK